MAFKSIDEIDVSQYPYINKGLEGLVAFSTNKSLVDGAKGELTYAGYNINDLAENATFEEVCYLLWFEQLPNTAELEDLNKKLQAERQLPKEVIQYIKTTSIKAEPMAVLRTATSMLADFDEESNVDNPEANLRKSIRMTAKMPTIIAAFDRVRNGKEIVDPLANHSTAYNFFYMLNGEHPGEHAEKVMDLCLILHAEHGMNASTFTCRAIAATMADIYSAVTGAIGSLKGPLHGGANTAVMNMLLELKPNTDIVAFIMDKLEKKEKIMGFGHRVYKTFDPRATHLRKMAKALSEEMGKQYLYEWSEKILETMKNEKNLDPNVDFFSATVYYSIGIMPDLYTCIFAMSRISGWTAHYLEQMQNNRLIRPKALYMGDTNTPWVSIEKR